MIKIRQRQYLDSMKIRANAARRLMFQNGVRAEQVTQVRGFADQRLRKADAPLDPANRRISLIVQYQEKKPSAESAPSEGEAAAPAEAKGPKAALESKSDAKQREPAAAPARSRLAHPTRSEGRHWDLRAWLDEPGCSTRRARRTLEARSPTQGSLDRWRSRHKVALPTDG